jgi:signal transduction histidine kinase
VEARLAAHLGLPPGTAACPATVRLDGSLPPARGWPLADAVRAGASLEVHDLAGRLGPFRAGPYGEPPQEAMIVPLKVAGREAPFGLLVAGISARLPLDDGYRAFLDLVAAGVGTAVSNARAYEQERSRAEALAELDRAKTDFFSNVSHEFRTPLTLMLGPLEDELAERTAPLPPARRERLETAHRNALRLLKLVNTLLDFSRIEAGRIQASYEPTDLAVFTAELASVFRSAVEKAGLTLSVEAPPLPEPVYVDREMWEKIVLNLLSNAFKHTFTGGIGVALRWAETEVVLTVSDTGVGVPAAELPRLFERFHRVKGARSRTHEGTGIGLALVQEVVRVHGGKVTVRSEEGRGSTFTVTVKTGRSHLPPERIGAGRTMQSTATHAAAYLEEAMRGSPAATVVVASSPLPGNRARILWADDNADMRDYVRRLLAEQYDVVAVGDGLEALARARTEPPDLVLTDVMMPGLDGFGLLRALRGDDLTRTVPVILLSARAGEEAAVEGLQAGADDYLAKPFSARELLARVRTHLEQARARRAWARDLEEANRELEAFSYSVSHDLRAPLRAIDGFSKALLADQADRLDDEGRHHLDRVRAATTRMSHLIDDLLNLSRLIRTPLRRQPVDLAELALTVLEELRRTDPTREVALEVEPELGGQADVRLMTVALENLLRNAWKFTSQRPRARITFGKVVRDGAPAFVVRDDGAGFDMAHAKHLFQPFQRLHRESEFPGTGIGLATVHRIILRHRGRLWAESAVDQGASFFFTLGDAP